MLQIWFLDYFSMSISSASELESSPMSFAASDSTSTWKGGIWERADGEKLLGGRGGGGCDYSRKAINRGMAIIRGNTVLILYPDFTYLARTKIISTMGTDSLLDLLAEVSHFSSHFWLVVRDLCKQGRYWVLIENRQKKTLSEKSQCVLIAKN